MPDPNQVIKIEEPYPQFYLHLHELISTQISLNKVKLTLMRIVLVIVIVYIVASVLAFIAGIVITILGMQVISSISSPLFTLPTIH